MLEKNRLWFECLQSIDGKYSLYSFLRDKIWKPYEDNHSVKFEFNYFSKTQWATTDFSNITINDKEIVMKEFNKNKSADLMDFVFWGLFKDNNYRINQEETEKTNFKVNDFVNTLNARLAMICQFIENKEKKRKQRNLKSNYSEYRIFYLDEEIATLISGVTNRGNSNNHISIYMYDVKKHPKGDYDKIVMFLLQPLPQYCAQIESPLFYKHVYMNRNSNRYNDGELAIENKSGYKGPNIFVYSIGEMLSNVEQINNGGSYKELSSEKEGKYFSGTYYRGQSNVDYDLSPSVQRNESLRKNENEIYHESLIRNPEEFKNITSYLGNLKKMQHYGVPTRLLDITKSLGVALYFATEPSNENDSKMGLVRVFKPQKQFEKSFDSDNVRVLCSFATMDEKTKEKILSYVKLSVVNISNFNSKLEVKKLLHEIESEVRFEPIINPETFKNNFFVQPLLDNRRIINQQGAFIIRASTNNDGEASVRSINSDVNMEIVIDINMKPKVQSFLKTIGIDETNIYPEISNVGEFIKNKYK